MGLVGISIILCFVGYAMIEVLGFLGMVLFVVLYFLAVGLYVFLSGALLTQLWMEEGVLSYSVRDPLGRNKKVYRIESVSIVEESGKNLILHGKVYMNDDKLIDQCTILKPDKAAVDLIESYAFTN